MLLKHSLLPEEGDFIFHACQNMQWDNLASWGNPTKSTKVNKVIVDIKKHEVWVTGVPTSAHHAVKWQEYVDVLTATCYICLSKPDASIIRLLTKLTLKWHLWTMNGGHDDSWSNLVCQ